MGVQDDLSKTSASESVYQLIRRRIVQGVYQPGGALKEADLAKGIGCSRTPRSWPPRRG
jgi:DNA-binding GntR family transcriptional regulator